MNVREALEKLLREEEIDTPACRSFRLAPTIERALRAAYAKGFSDGADDGVVDTVESLLTDNGVTAGVAAMVEES